MYFGLQLLLVVNVRLSSSNFYNLAEILKSESWGLESSIVADSRLYRTKLIIFNFNKKLLCDVINDIFFKWLNL